MKPEIQIFESHCGGNPYKPDFLIKVIPKMSQPIVIGAPPRNITVEEQRVSYEDMENCMIALKIKSVSEVFDRFGEVCSWFIQKEKKFGEYVEFKEIKA